MSRPNRNRPRTRFPTLAEAIEPRLYLSTAAPSDDGIATAPIVVVASGLTSPDGDSSPSGAPLNPTTMRATYGLGTVGNGNVTFGGVHGNGSGQTIAILAGGNDRTIVSDLAAFDSHYALPAPPGFKVMNQAGGTEWSPSRRTRPSRPPRSRPSTRRPRPAILGGELPVGNSFCAGSSELCGTSRCSVPGRRRTLGGHGTRSSQVHPCRRHRQVQVGGRRP